MWAGFVGANAGQGIDAALVLANEAVAVFQEVEDPRSLGDATTLLASIAAGSGRNEEAIRRFGESQAIYAQFDDDFSRAVTANAAGRAAWVRGDLDDADRLMRESVRHFKAAGVEWANALVNDDIAVVAEMRGDIGAAIEGTMGAREAAGDLGLRGAEAVLLARLGNYALACGDIDGAARLHREAIALAEEVGFNWARGMAMNGRAMGHRATGELDLAEECAEEARNIYRAAGVPPGEVLALASLGFVAARRGDVEAARLRHDEALALAREMEDQRSIALAYEGLASVAVLEGDGARAATLLGAADALRSQGGADRPGRRRTSSGSSPPPTSSSRPPSTPRRSRGHHVADGRVAVIRDVIDVGAVPCHRVPHDDRVVAELGEVLTAECRRPLEIAAEHQPDHRQVLTLPPGDPAGAVAGGCDRVGAGRAGSAGSGAGDGEAGVSERERRIQLDGTV